LNIAGDAGNRFPVRDASQRLRHSQNLVAELHRQVFGGEHRHLYAKQSLGFLLQAGEGKQGCASRGVNQQVKIALVVVVAEKYRTVDARVCDAVAADKLP